MKSQPESHTHLQFAPADTQPKVAKEYVLPAHGLKDNAAKMKENLTGKINNETLTSGNISRNMLFKTN
jgi:hypothetical protein